MSRHRTDVVLRQMLEYCEEACEMASSRTREHLDRDRMFELASLRLLEVIGEAATRVDVETRNHLRQVPWQQMEPPVVPLRVGKRRLGATQPCDAPGACGCPDSGGGG
ncbi:MAG: DUF86 domain-containing protein, partial [Armatimonadia bacterium]|nr:DUF86 domain-containing protein [Armatimonadia bacterium]